MPRESSFTLIELLIVIGILAVLAIVAVVTLNPLELIKQSRDSNRMADLATLNKALAVYQSSGQTNLGTANTIYVSIPSNQSNCSDLGLPTPPFGWTYACVPSSTLRNVNGTGWIPLPFNTVSYGAPLEKLPVDPINATSTYNYYEYIPGGSWKFLAVLESDKYSAKSRQDGGTASSAYEEGTDMSLGNTVFPSIWVKVPGNGDFGTSDFWAMKYNAKCISGITPLISPEATPYHTYYDSSAPCISANSKHIASTPDGYPIAYISHNTALTYCQSLGAHLLTNDEYMTIARNAEQVGNNWSGGSPGSGYMYSGHNDNAPAYALTADISDSNGYAGETNINGNQRRTLTLSNGSVVWDMAGNVWQHVQRSVNNVGDLTTTMALPACSDGVAGWGWCQYASGASPYISSWTSDVVQAKVGPSDSSWYSSQGVGQVYTYKNGTSQSTTVFIRGGSWDAGSNAGAGALYLAWGAGSTGSSVGAAVPGSRGVEILNLPAEKIFGYFSKCLTTSLFIRRLTISYSGSIRS